LTQHISSRIPGDSTLIASRTSNELTKLMYNPSWLGASLHIRFQVIGQNMWMSSNCKVRVDFLGAAEDV